MIDWLTLTEHELRLLCNYGNVPDIVLAAKREQARRRCYDKVQLELVYHHSSSQFGLVNTGYECPNCGENHLDLLVWREDNTGVECRKCGHYYNL